MREKIKKQKLIQFISIFILTIDQITKFVVKNFLLQNISQYVCAFLNWTLVLNSGIAFSFLSNLDEYKKWILNIFCFLTILIIIFLLIKNNKNILLFLAFSLILSGGIGNFIDRILYGAVIDFIDFHYHSWHWPIFNIADCSLTIGIIVLIVNEIKSKNYESIKT